MQPRSTAELQAALAKVAIVLVEPKYAENIGAAARGAMNMGVSQLIVVRREAPDREKMARMATHHAVSLLDNLALFPDLETALAPFSVVVGTTARQGRQRRPPNTPRVMVEKVIPLLAENRVAILFGPEHRGLTNDDLKFCKFTSSIPTAEFTSLNLAQAVAIHCYELYHGLLFGDGAADSSPKLAATRELEGMYDHVAQLLRQVEFLKEGRAEGENDYWMNSIRKFFGRQELQAKEVKMIRGFCKQFLRYEKEKRG
ncbi:MAG: RNA methyltransferase [Desulfurivibrionaceae bacterium]|nr:RNA methyltransferase [Desulfobulbales bacterium]MDT8335202.1 RNA methyltransferase [Desulfurivibrionaceae bacterium]